MDAKQLTTITEDVLTYLKKHKENECAEVLVYALYRLGYLKEADTPKSTHPCVHYDEGYCTLVTPEICVHYDYVLCNYKQGE